MMFSETLAVNYPWGVDRSAAVLELSESLPPPQAFKNIPSSKRKEIFNFSFFIGFTNFGILARLLDDTKNWSESFENTMIIYQPLL